MKNKKIQLLTNTGVLAAAVFVLTAFLHIPVFTGYVHAGDGLIYLAAMLLPKPYAMFVGAFGGALADVTSGFVSWAPGTAVIKALLVIGFSKKHKPLSARNMLALVIAAAVSVGGYYLYESLITMNFVAPLVSIVPNLVQALASSLLYLFAAAVIKKK